MTTEKSAQSSKEKMLLTTIEKLERQYGKGIIMKLGEKPKIAIETIPSGSLALDYALGTGGFPRGRIIEIYGPEASGKTTIALHTIAEVQKRKGVCAFIDAEHALDIRYAKAIGVDISNLYVAQPDDGEQALEIADQLIVSGGVDLIVIDSVAALVPRAEIEGNMGDAQMALQARLMSQAMRKITGSLSKTKTTIIFINQLRSKVGYVFGNPETTSGGNALKFYSSVRLDIRRTEQIKKLDIPIGAKLKIKVIKNKVAPPFRQAETTIIYGEGISTLHEIIDMATKYDIIQKSGSWYSYNDERLAQGLDNLKNVLVENKSLLTELEKKVRTELSKNNLDDDATDEKPSASEKKPESDQSKLADKKTKQEEKLEEASKKIML